MIAFTLPLRLENESNERNKWATIERSREHRAAAFMETKAATRRASLPDAFVVTLERCGPGTMDDDGVRSAFKAVRDGIADALVPKYGKGGKLVSNDDDPRVTWRYKQIITKRVPTINSNGKRVMVGVYQARIVIEPRTHVCVCRECDRGMDG